MEIHRAKDDRAYWRIYGVGGLKYGYVSDDGYVPKIGDIMNPFMWMSRIMSKIKNIDIVSPQLSLLDSFSTCIARCTVCFIRFKFWGTQFCHIFEPAESYILSYNPENKIFADLGSSDNCVEPSEYFARTALPSGLDAWSYVDFLDKNVLKAGKSGYHGFILQMGS